MQELLLEFTGRLTLANAQQELWSKQQVLSAAKEKLHDCKVVADLSQLTEVDTSALAVIVQLDRELRVRSGQPLGIRGASEDLRSLARLSSLDALLNWE